jgi:hypothetical protein
VDVVGEAVLGVDLGPFAAGRERGGQDLADDGVIEHCALLAGRGRAWPGRSAARRPLRQ